MSKFSKQLDYLVTSLILMGAGLLFLFLNRGLNTYPALHFSIFQICQSVLLLIMAALSFYGELGRKKAAQPPEDGEAPQEAKDTVDSVNATMLLVMVTVLVTGFYMFTARLSDQVQGVTAPIHMVVCVVAFILYACAEKWWSMKLKQIRDAYSICNLMVMNKAGIILLFLDMVMSFTGLFPVTRYVNYGIVGLWLYLAIAAAASVAVKVLRHGNELEFFLYVPLPFFYRQWGAGHSTALDWLEQNTGISMRSLWSLKFLSTTLPVCALGVVLVLWLSTCFVQVDAYQQAALYHFGRLEQENILQPGLHLKLPAPFEVAKVYDVSRSKTMIVGYEGDVESQNNLWTMAHKGEEQKLLLGAGRELVAINLKVIYRICDLHAYLTNYTSPESALNAKGYEIVMHATVDTDINTIISEDRSVLSHQIEAQLKDYARQADLGLEVMSVTLASIHPPIEIADVYQSVVSARIQKQAAILTAEGTALVSKEQAEADRQVAVNQAGIARDERVSAANAEVTEYNASIEAYQLDPKVYELDRYLDTVQSTLTGRQKYLLGTGVDQNSLYSGFLNPLFRGSQTDTGTAGSGTGKDGAG